MAALSLRDQCRLSGFLAHKSLFPLKWPILLYSDNTLSLFICKMKVSVSSVTSHFFCTFLIRVFFLQFGSFPIVLKILVTCLIVQ